MVISLATNNSKFKSQKISDTWFFIQFSTFWIFYVKMATSERGGGLHILLCERAIYILKYTIYIIHISKMSCSMIKKIALKTLLEREWNIYIYIYIIYKYIYSTSLAVMKSSEEILFYWNPPSAIRRTAVRETLHWEN